jgi:prophage DNA circulation protein
MAWQDRIQEAAYSSASGTRATFDYEDVSTSIEKKTRAFNFPDADGTYIQELGKTGRRYPLRIFFWGDDYDTEADAFEELLLERGVGKLEHPKYGTVDVVPFGEIGRRDDLKTAANQAIIEVTFWATIGIVYPASQTDPSSDVVSAIGEYNEATASEFENLTDLDSASERASLKGTYNALLGGAKSGLQAIADTQEDVQKQFNAIDSSINNAIDILIRDPLTLAFQTVQLIQSPARAITDIQARLSAYGDLASAIFSGDGSIFSTGYDSTNSNDFHTNDLYASTYITGMMLSVVNNEFETKTDALSSAEFILDQFASVVDWRDENFESLGEIDTGASYQQLQEAVALAAGFLVEISFTLKQERTLTLDRDRSIIELVAELYGGIDEFLDFFISSNNLSGSEIIELPRGRKIVYYI